MENQYDAVVVGGGIAGCAAAVLLARRGLRVALLERHGNPAHFKKLCTHSIPASATGTLQRLGLAEAIEARGGIRNCNDIFVRWGWIRDPQMDPSPHAGHGYSIRREVLDPLLRQLALDTPNLELLAGHAVTGLIDEQDRICGVVATDSQGASCRFRAKLVVAADGRHSTLAQLCGVPTKRKPHHRFAYFAYYKGLQFPKDNRLKLWFMMPDVAYVFPNDDGQLVAVCAPHKDRLSEWKSDPEGKMFEFFDALPEAPALRQGQRVSPVFGVADLPNILRPAAHRGMALVGDAALAADPIWGVGCGWALQSAEWLADAVAEALLGREPLPAALQRYRKRHRRELAGHEFLISDFATGRPFNFIERLMFSAATRDSGLAHNVALFGGRSIGFLQFLAPGKILRSIWVNLRHWIGKPVVRQPQIS
jgi:2-polyprenyl-6-methoxyphenol hydroxylase-like FAD-dependent oxidoreductase